MAIDLEQIRKDLFADHGLAISKDDPILAFLATHDVILKQYGTHIEKAIAEGLGNYENAAIKSNKELLDEARKTANHILNQSLNEVVRYIDEEKKELINERENKEIDKSENNKNLGILLILTSINSIFLVGLFLFAFLS